MLSAIWDIKILDIILTLCYIFRSDAKIPIKLALLNGKFVSCIPHMSFLQSLECFIMALIGLLDWYVIKKFERFRSICASLGWQIIKSDRTAGLFHHFSTYLILFVQHPCPQPPSKWYWNLGDQFFLLLPLPQDLSLLGQSLCHVNFDSPSCMLVFFIHRFFPSDLLTTWFENLKKKEKKFMHRVRDGVNLNIALTSFLS